MSNTTISEEKINNYAYKIMTDFLKRWTRENTQYGFFFTSCMCSELGIHAQNYGHVLRTGFLHVCPYLAVNSLGILIALKLFLITHGAILNFF